MVKLYHAAGYYLSLFLFGIFGLGVNIVSLLCAWLPDTRGTQRWFQRLVHRNFRLFIWWMSFLRLFRIDYRGLERLPRTGGLVIAVNHPGLMDITYLLAVLPEAICVFKPAIRRNPVLGAAARRAGYLVSSGGLDMVREAAARVASGDRLVIFPEGTRTPHGGSLRPFKPGFAVIATRARVPVQVVRIACNSNILTRERAWWKVPQLPVLVTVDFGPQIAAAGDRRADELLLEVAEWFGAPAEIAARDAHRTAAVVPAKPL